jgi:xanthine dehydrogenase accessory factor
VTDGEANLLLEARRSVERGVPAALVTVVRGGEPGRKLLVAGDTVMGSLGMAELDEKGADRGREALQSEVSGLIALTDGVDAFVDVFPLPPLLVIVGAVHVAQALVPFAERLGFHIAVVDARAALATQERFPTISDLIVSWPDEAYERLPITRTSAIVILTHDPKFDEPAIVGAMKTEAGYIGAVGSRKTNADRRDRLLEAGLTDEDLERLHGPIGLDIGGRSPEEMAISILGEIIATRNGRSGGSLRGAKGNIRAGHA